MTSRDKQIQAIINQYRKEVDVVNQQQAEHGKHSSSDREWTRENVRLQNERAGIKANAFDRIAALFD